MSEITANDCLEIRDAGGETLHKGVDIFEIDKEKIYSHMGTFIIDGSKNESGEETFIPLVLPEDYNATHAVICTEKRLKNE